MAARDQVKAEEALIHLNQIAAFKSLFIVLIVVMIVQEVEVALL
jgi:hypothetical protein